MGYRCSGKSWLDTWQFLEALGNSAITTPASPATYGTSLIGAAENWIGTKDANDWVVGTNQIERMRVKQTSGNVGIGLAAPTEHLHVYTVNNSNKSAIYSYASQNSAATDYDNRAIVGQAKGKSFLYGYAYGVVGMIDDVNSYYGTGVYAGIGTTLPTGLLGYQAVYADAGTSGGYAGIFMNGNVGVGITAPTFTVDVLNTNINEIYRGRNGFSTGTITQVGSIEYIQDWANALDFQTLAGFGGIALSVGLGGTAAYDLQLAAGAFNGGTAAKPGGGSWTNASDANLKEDIHSFKDGLSTIRNIRPVYYKYNGKACLPKNYYVGVVAQELKDIAPYMVSTFEYLPGNPRTLEEAKNKVETYFSVDNSALAYVTVNSLKELDETDKVMQKTFKNVSDFGTIAITSHKTFVPYSQEFKTLFSGTIPTVVVSVVNAVRPVAIAEQSKDGFYILQQGDKDSILTINWIAMAKVNDTIWTQGQQNYTAQERQDMLDKVKIKPAEILPKIEQEEKAMKIRKAEEAAKANERANKPKGQ